MVHLSVTLGVLILPRLSPVRRVVFRLGAPAMVLDKTFITAATGTLAVKRNITATIMSRKMESTVITPSASLFPPKVEKNFGFIRRLTEQINSTKLNLPRKRSRRLLRPTLKRLKITFINKT